MSTAQRPDGPRAMRGRRLDPVRRRMRRATEAAGGQVVPDHRGRRPRHVGSDRSRRWRKGRGPAGPRRWPPCTRGPRSAAGRPRERRRERDLELALHRANLDREAGVARDPRPCGGCRASPPRRRRSPPPALATSASCARGGVDDAVPLPRVGDRERDLRLADTEPDVLRMTDDVVAPMDACDEAAPVARLPASDWQRPADRPPAEESGTRATSARQAAVKGSQRVRVGGLDRAHVNRRAVPQRDIGLDGHRPGDDGTERHTRRDRPVQLRRSHRAGKGVVSMRAGPAARMLSPSPGCHRRRDQRTRREAGVHWFWLLWPVSYLYGVLPPARWLRPTQGPKARKNDTHEAGLCSAQAR